MYRYSLSSFIFFFFNDTATTEIYTLSLTTLFRSLPHRQRRRGVARLPEDRTDAEGGGVQRRPLDRLRGEIDRKSTRLNSSHANISYAVFCLKKKNKNQIYYTSHSL